LKDNLPNCGEKSNPRVVDRDPGSGCLIMKTPGAGPALSSISSLIKNGCFSSAGSLVFEVNYGK
jgi:hypothetical protein